MCYWNVLVLHVALSLPLGAVVCYAVWQQPCAVTLCPVNLHNLRSTVPIKRVISHHIHRFLEAGWDSLGGEVAFQKFFIVSYKH